MTENNADIVELRGFQIPPVKAFMDNTTILSSKELICKILSLMDKQIIWCRMKFKPQKSRSLSLRKGKVNLSINLKVGGQRTSIMSEELVKSLGH